jgi:hypothetical protein
MMPKVSGSDFFLGVLMMNEKRWMKIYSDE